MLLGICDVSIETGILTREKVMNRGQIRDKILYMLNQDVDSPQFWEEDFINNRIDEAYMNFVSRTKILETSASLTLLAYQNLYEFASDCLVVNRMYYETTDKMIDPATWSNLVKFDPSWSDKTGDRPERWVFIPPNKMFLYPAVTADSTDAVTYYYSKMPADFTADTTSPDFPAIFHDALIEYPLTVALLRMGSAGYLKMANGYWAKYQEKIKSAKKFNSRTASRQIRIRSRF